MSEMERDGEVRGRDVILAEIRRSTEHDYAASWRGCWPVDELGNSTSSKGSDCDEVAAVAVTPSGRVSTSVWILPTAEAFDSTLRCSTPGNSTELPGRICRRNRINSLAQPYGSADADEDPVGKHLLAQMRFSVKLLTAFMQCNISMPMGNQQSIRRTRYTLRMNQSRSQIDYPSRQNDPASPPIPFPATQYRGQWSPTIHFPHNILCEKSPPGE
ncbi:uncharacterized protein EI97DRAFT_498909 [Westerdykella ornata]|uniref:Uncharacterized protein n=1 Tax=Westerdykella ornata TaxID=318751 RepID=A0A6A6JST1_WESOR|nr:uncharacterized protein EI97DRAFT_498909 [Westerdykella ornata]KAF2279447.1 hypothetical protein EI97DRAFT_498909 [Westerdykella ornata]